MVVASAQLRRPQMEMGVFKASCLKVYRVMPGLFQIILTFRKGKVHGNKKTIVYFIRHADVAGTKGSNVRSTSVGLHFWYITGCQ